MKNMSRSAQWSVVASVSFVCGFFLSRINPPASDALIALFFVILAWAWIPPLARWIKNEIEEW